MADVTTQRSSRSPDPKRPGTRAGRRRPDPVPGPGVRDMSSTPPLAARVVSCRARPAPGTTERAHKNEGERTGRPQSVRPRSAGCPVWLLASVPAAPSLPRLVSPLGSLRGTGSDSDIPSRARAGAALSSRVVSSASRACAHEQQRGVRGHGSGSYLGGGPIQCAPEQRKRGALQRFINVPPLLTEKPPRLVPLLLVRACARRFQYTTAALRVAHTRELGERGIHQPPIHGVALLSAEC
jgi:hypothetical protein